MLFVSLLYFKFSQYVNYKALLTIAVIIAATIPILALLLSKIAASSSKYQPTKTELFMPEYLVRAKYLQCFFH